MSVKKTVDVKHIDKAFEEIFNTYSFKMQQELQKAVDNGGREYRKYIKEKYEEDEAQKIEPYYKHRQKSYKTLFATKSMGTLARRLKNTDYRLSHLLENGHEVYNQYGGPYEIHPHKIVNGRWVYGSEYHTKGSVTRKMGFWKKTYAHIEEDLPKRIEKIAKTVKP